MRMNYIGMMTMDIVLKIFQVPVREEINQMKMGV